MIPARQPSLDEVLTQTDELYAMGFSGDAYNTLRKAIQPYRPRTSAPAPATIGVKQCEHWYRGVGDSVIMCHKPYCENAAAKAAREQAETTDNILTVLKKRYGKEMAIIDYIEMIECEVESLRQQEPSTKGGDR